MDEALNAGSAPLLVGLSGGIIAAYHAPCGVWHGETGGRRCLLLCDGFVARPRRVDPAVSFADVEWLAQVLARRGPDVLEELEGQFAICFADEQGGTLLAARDRLGGQSVYWHQSEEVAAVASKSRFLARLPCCSHNENPQFIADMFSHRGRRVPGQTPFLHVSEVSPGGRIELRGARCRTHRAPVEAPPPEYQCESQWIEAFDAAFRRAVMDAAGADSDVAVMLSGGLDSGPVLQVLADELRSGSRQVVATSWTLPDFPECDEIRYIRLAADSAGVAVSTFDGGDHRPFANLDSSVISPELPYYNAVRDILLQCYRRAADEDCNIVLAGTRGDMIYPQRFTVINDLIRRRDWPGLWTELVFLYRRLGLKGLFRDPAVRYPVAVLRKRIRAAVAPGTPSLTGDALENLSDVEDWPPEIVRFPNPEHARLLLGSGMTFGTAQENDFCQRFGVERRDPFHSEALVRLMLHLPAVLGHRQGREKWIMREAMRNRIPDSIRLKQRTGILTGFIRSCFQERRGQVREFLLDQDDDGWARYVRREAIDGALRAEECTDSELLSVCACIGYTLWCEYWSGVRDAR